MGSEDGSAALIARHLGRGLRRAALRPGGTIIPCTSKSDAQTTRPPARIPPLQPPPHPHYHTHTRTHTRTRTRTAHAHAHTHTHTHTHTHRDTLTQTHRHTQADRQTGTQASSSHTVTHTHRLKDTVSWRQAALGKTVLYGAYNLPGSRGDGSRPKAPSQCCIIA